MTINITQEEQRALDEIRTRLTAHFADIDSTLVDAAISDAHSRFEGGKIRDFVPLFVERDAIRRLSASQN